MSDKINLPYVLFLAVTAATGGLLFGFDIAIISGAGPFLVQHFGLNDLSLGVAFSSLLFGCVIGSAVAGCAAALTVRVTPSPALDLIAGLAVGVAVYLLVLGRWFFRLLGRGRLLWSTGGSQRDEDVDAAVTTGPDASGLVTP